MITGTRKQKGIESLSENREWRRRCVVERQVVPDGGTRNRKRTLADCIHFEDFFARIKSKRMPSSRKSTWA